MKLLAPVGDWIMLRAAVAAGADEVYLGIKGLNMRAAAKNFDPDELKEIVDFCHNKNVKVNVTVNTIVFDEELEKIRGILDTIKQSEADAVICWDLAIITLCIEKKIPFHISTQASVANAEAAKFFENLGAERIILARELSLEQIKKIKEKTNIEIESFGHGAMCVSVSGRCFMSQSAFGKSANRGECLQPCRREYNIKDIDEEKEFKLGTDYVMSPKDLCTLPFLEKLYNTIDVIKIEGRGRSPEYVKTVIEAYREAIDAIKEDNYAEELKKKLIEKVKTVYNRGFSSGFFLGKPADGWTDDYGSKATTRKEYVGVVKNFYNEQGVAEIRIDAGALKVGDEIQIHGPTTGVISQKIESMEMGKKQVDQAEKGQSVGIKLKSRARTNDQVYIIKSNENR